MSDAYIYDAVRSPRAKGRPGGGLSSVQPHDLVAQLVDALRERTAGAAVDHADRLVLSCVGQVGAQGGHIALVSKLAATLPDRVVPHSLNNYCVGGLSAIGHATAAVESGQASLVLAGGVEMMSHVAFLADDAALYSDPLASELRWTPVGVAADHLAHRHDVGRATLDELSIESHRRAALAWESGRYDDHVVPIHDADGNIVIVADETIRPDLSMDDLAALPPAFEAIGAATYDAVIAGVGAESIEHRHSVANCPPIADGAALTIVGNAEAGEQMGLEPIARIEAIVEMGADPLDQLTAGRAAMDRLLEDTDLTLAEMDRIEFMEAFAVVSALFHREHDVDRAIVNPDGGHLAMGHPMGATGAILTAALAHGLRRDGAIRGLVVASGGSGVGVAALLSREGLAS
ncbi:MAG: acetyl-CoA C-acyltransferase [Acidimicrobiales bacterium]